jgi:tRNA pseudouridine38-40 synthase
MGASRTDTGVHAIEQVIKISSEHQIECESFVIKLNKTLPSQIRCMSVVSCQGSFRPNGGVSKEYRYLFTNKLQSSCVEQMFIANNPYSLDLELMKKCAQKIIGKHDFRNFCSAGSNVKTTIRKISACEINEVNPHTVLPQSDLFLLPHDLIHCYQLRIEGTGFLKQMVRHLMSAIWLVGRGKLSSDEFLLLLNGSEKPKRLWKVASPRGLYLYRFNHLRDNVLHND